MEERGRTDEERAELEDVFRAQQAEMEERFAATSAAREEHRVLQERLAAMEAKVVKGGTNLLDQEQRLVEEARIREEKMRKMETYAEEQRRRIEDLENLDSIAGESYASVDEEIESKTSKIERLKQAYRRCAADIEDLDDEFVQERDELLEQVRAPTRRIKLKNLVLDFCAPPERLAEISERCRWDDGASGGSSSTPRPRGTPRARAARRRRASARFWRRRNYSAAAGPYRGEERNANVPRRMVYGFARASAPEARFRRKKKRSSRFRSPRGGWSAPSRTSRATRRARERWPRARMRRRCSPRTSPTTRSRRGGMYKVARGRGAARRMRAATRRFPTGRRPRRRARASSRRARPGTARNPRRGRDEGLDALRARESDAARFPVARGLVKPRRARSETRAKREARSVLVSIRAAPGSFLYYGHARAPQKRRVTRLSRRDEIDHLERRASAKRTPFESGGGARRCHANGVAFLAGPAASAAPPSRATGGPPRRPRSVCVLFLEKDFRLPASRPSLASSLAAAAAAAALAPRSSRVDERRVRRARRESGPEKRSAALDPRNPENRASGPSFVSPASATSATSAASSSASTSSSLERAPISATALARPRWQTRA